MWTERGLIYLGPTILEIGEYPREEERLVVLEPEDEHG